MNKLLTLAAALLLAQSAHAASTTSTVTVTATVQSACTLSGGSASGGDTTADFGTYNTALGSTVLTAGGNVVSVNCTLGTLYTAKLGAGQHDLAGQRRLENQGTAGNFLNYNVGLVDAGGLLNSVIGVALPFVGVGLPVPLVIQGSIPSGQNPLIGTYRDQLTLTISY
jgi:spore coat protein U-like protein